MGVIIFDVVVVRLVEHAVRVVIAVWVLVSYSARLAHRRVWIEATEACSTGATNTSWSSTCAVCIWALARDEEDSLVEAANDWDLWLLLLLLWVLASALLRCLRAALVLALSHRRGRCRALLLALRRGHLLQVRGCTRRCLR